MQKFQLKYHQFRHLCKRIGGIYHLVISQVMFEQDDAPKVLIPTAEFCLEMQNKYADNKFFWVTTPESFTMYGYEWLTNSGNRLSISFLSDTVEVSIDSSSHICDMVAEIISE